jgi:hypothetical protein
MELNSKDVFVIVMVDEFKDVRHAIGVYDDFGKVSNIVQNIRYAVDVYSVKLSYNNTPLDGSCILVGMEPVHNKNVAVIASAVMKTDFGELKTHTVEFNPTLSHITSYIESLEETQALAEPKPKKKYKVYVAGELIKKLRANEASGTDEDGIDDITDEQRAELNSLLDFLA